MSIQNLLYATVVAVGAPLVINGDITTGAMVAASMLSDRMVAPMTALCGTGSLAAGESRESKHG